MKYKKQNKQTKKKTFKKSALFGTEPSYNTLHIRSLYFLKHEEHTLMRSNKAETAVTSYHCPDRVDQIKIYYKLGAFF